ncbi:MAG: hypothetical protein P9L99_19820 [Candidatus Lernaella stagnicola]|nr:hypothetical protein [Candidatus Lernaella stagnicola]
MAESAFGTAAELAATDAFRFTDLTITPNEERLGRNDVRPGSRSKEASITGKRSVEGAFTIDDAPSGTVGTVVDIDPLYLTAYGKATNAGTYTVQAAPAPSTTGCTVNDSTGLSIGDLVSVPCADENGVSVAIAVCISNIATNALTWAPALPNTPAAAATIRSGIQYSLSAANTASATVYKYYGIDSANYHADLVECAAGVVVGKWEYDIDPGGLAVVAASFAAKDLARFMAMGVNEDVAADETDWDVDDCLSEIHTAGRCTFIMGTDAVSDETVICTATDSNNDIVTVSRNANGAGAGTYDADDSMYPFYPGATTGGSAVAGILGRIYFGGTKYDITAAKVTHVEGKALRTDTFGDATATGIVSAAQREVTVELTGYLTSDEDRWQIADRKTATAVWVQAGTTQGSIHAWYLPTVEFDMPAISGAKGEEIPLTLRGAAYAPTGSPETELRHAYL